MYITSAARLRFDIAYNINKLRTEKNRRLHNNSWSMTLPLWCEMDSWHVSYLQRQSPPSKTGQIFMMIPTFLPHHMQFMLMLSIHYIMQANSENFIIVTIIRLCRDFTTAHSYYTQHEYCRLLADGKRIFHMECYYSFTTVLDRRPRSSYPC